MRGINQIHFLDVIQSERKGETLFFLFTKKDYFMNISESQIFIALFSALITGILAVRLGIELYVRPES